MGQLITQKSKIKNQKSKIENRKFTRRYPAEWEKQCATWLSWPHNEKEWGKKRLPKIKEFYKKLISTILQFQSVNLIFANEEAIREFTLRGLKKIIIPNNDIWIRDYGPFFLEKINGNKKESMLLDFGFNAWGGKFPPWDLDNNVPKEIALYLGIKDVESYPIVLEGGAVEFSGDGLLLTTEQCLLNKNRNPELNKNQIESILKSAFNIEEIIWLERGLEGDHTDGHIDDVARFVSPNKVLICQTKSKKDKNYEHLKESREYLKRWRHPQNGKKLEVIEIPLPDKIKLKGERLPNSYANFIFVNDGIIMPLFQCDTDKKALDIFKNIFPKRKIVGVDCSLLIEEGGGLHCMTKQEAFI